MRLTFRKLLQSPAPAANLLIRVMVGGIFLSEGLQKFLYPADLGSGRFEKIGIAAADFFGPFVGLTEIICGLLLLLGLATRLASIPLIITMLVALLTTKVPILLGEEFLGFALRPLPRYGLLSMLHESRTDFCMLVGSIYLLLTGAGRLSLDAKIVSQWAVPVLGLFAIFPGTLSAQTPPAPRVTHTVILSPWEKTVTLPAEAGPYYRIALGTPATGWVESIEADAGSRVKKGDLLASINAPELVAARDARAEEARAAIQKIEQARAILASTEATARASESEFSRLRALAGSGTVTPKARDEAEARYEASKAGVGEARAGIAAAEADSLAAAARTTEAEAVLAYTRLLAPYDGLVVSRRAELGDFLDGGAKGADLFTFEQTDPLRVRLYVPEHAAALTKPGQTLILRLGGEEFSAELTRVSGSLDPVTRTVTAEVDLKGSDLLPGTFGAATMTLAKLESAALVPLAAVRTGADRSRYLVVLDGEARKNVPVTLHSTEGSKAVLTGDLVAGMIVLLP